MNEIQIANKFKKVEAGEKAKFVDEFLGVMKKEEKNLDEIEKLSSFDVTGRKPNASGGLAGMLGE